ncbi:hypothetical protein BH11MYX3_BH11MYX3_19540 [soil metagenome]
MKGRLAFDPADYDYGPATLRVRELITQFADIDWFAPPHHAGDTERGHALFARHRELCALHRSDLVSAAAAIAQVWGNWTDFVALCTRVRSPHSTYDWKHSGLKRMSADHAKAGGWSNEAAAVDMLTSRPGDLFLKVNDFVMVNVLAPQPQLRAFVPDRCQEAAGFYWNYATGDFHDAIRWELAEPAAPPDRNPYVPLLQCYAAGCYPFVVSPTEVRMFSFKRGELPVARVVR